MLICSHIVENSTDEATYFPGPSRKARVIWLQRSGTVSDQAFESFAIFPREAQVLVRTSQRAPESNHQKEPKTEVGNESQKSPNEASGHSEQTPGFTAVLEPVSRYLAAENVKTIGGTAIGVCGFVVQFTGLRGMHWSASVAQLGATVLMTVLRAWVRRDLAELPRALPVVPGHELDWLAMTFGGKPEKAPWRQPPEEDGKWDKDSRPWAEGDGWDWDTVTIRDPAELEALQPYKEGCNSQSRAGRVVKIRRDLGKLADWYGPASAEAIMLARSIEIAMDALFGDLSGNFTWPLKIGDEEILFRVDRETKGWRTYADEIEAALSLWLYSVNNKERGLIRDGDGDAAVDDDKWLRSKEASAKPSLRLIGSFTPALHQNLRWWMPDAAVSVVRAVQTSIDDASMMTFDAHRVVGFLAGSSSQPTGPAEQNWYMLQGFREDSSEDTPSEASETAANVVLAVESYNPLATLFVQHMFSSFMWAATKKMEDKDRMASKVDVRPTDTDRMRDDGTWQSFTLHNNQLSAMAQAIQSTGLGTLEEVYMCIIPPLSAENKLPQPDSIIDWTRTHAERHERRGHWKEAGDAYIWLFQTTKFTHGHENISIKAIALLMEILMAVTDAVKLRKAQMFQDSGVDELDWLKSNILSKLRSNILDEPDAGHSTSVIGCLMWLFQYQGRPWGCPFVEALKTPKDINRVLGLTTLHRFAREFRSRYNAVEGQTSQESARGIREFDFSSYWERLEEMHGAPTTEERDILGWTAFHYAATGTVEAVRKLLEYRFDANARDIRGRTPLHYACRHNNISVVDVLLREGVEANRQDLDGRAPIHHAAEQGHTRVIQWLIEAGADVNLADALGYTPLFWAAYNGHRESVDHLRKDSNMKLRDYNGRTPLHLVIIGDLNDGLERKGAAELLLEPSSLIEAKDKFGRTPLHYAAMSDHKDIVRLLLENGAPVDLRDNNGKAPLHHAAISGNEAIVRLLLENGAPADAGEDGWDSTPLHCAAMSGHKDIVRLLLEKGTPVNVTNHYGDTPLHRAAVSGHEDIVRLLLENGALVDARNRDDDTLLHYAAMSNNKDIVRLFLEDGIPVDVRNHYGDTPLHSAAMTGHKDNIRPLLENGIPVDVRNHRGNTPLHRAAYYGHEDIVRLLLGNGTPVDVRNHKGGTALHEAAHHGHEDIVRLLLENGATVGVSDADGQTPLYYAVERKRKGIVWLLLTNDSSIAVETRDRLGRTVLDMAVENGHEGITLLLQVWF